MRSGSGGEGPLRPSARLRKIKEEKGKKDPKKAEKQILPSGKGKNVPGCRGT